MEVKTVFVFTAETMKSRGRQRKKGKRREVLVKGRTIDV